MSVFYKIYVEIGNICNLNCSFCPTLQRERRQMSADEFAEVCKKISPYTSHVYLHVMGEPLLHPELDAMLDIAESNGLKVCITTNGTLLYTRGEILLAHAEAIHKISVSLHCIEGNDIEYKLEKYITEVVDFSRKAAEKGIYTILRLWNLDSKNKRGANLQNDYIEKRLHDEFDGVWKKRWNGFCMSERVFLEYAEIFSWACEEDGEISEHGYCRGLGDQIAILADGTVTPCCIDSEGKIALGNIFRQSLDEILSGERAVNIKEGFAVRELREELCQKCGYAKRFSKKGEGQ